MTEGITTSFTDNLAVTAEELNNIAIDLGKTDFAAFSAEEKFGNDALNQITKDLVSSGILYLNDRCNCTLTEDGSQINIATGVAVFADGSKIRITSPQTVDVLTNGTNYVYFKNDTISGRATLENSLTEPTEGDFIKLCTLTDGVVTDERVYAHMNANLNLTTSAYEIVTLNNTLTVTKENKQATVPVTINLRSSDYIYIVCLGDSRSMSVFDMRTKEVYGYYYNGREYKPISSLAGLLYSNTTGYTWPKEYEIRFVSLISNQLTLKLTYTYNSVESTSSHTFGTTFILI